MVQESKLTSRMEFAVHPDVGGDPDPNTVESTPIASSLKLGWMVVAGVCHS